MIDRNFPIVNDAQSILSTLRTTADNVQLAMEADATARRTAKEAKQSYESAEAEFIAEAMLSIDGKNAESRKAQLDAVLVKARGNGELSRLWAMMNAAQYAADEAKTALDQEHIAFTATKYAAELASSLLRALA